MSLASKKIALGVTGGIAAYKACELVRRLKKAEAQVRVAMSDAAQKFVAPLTFATLSENPVVTSLFHGQEETGIKHIDLARWSDLFVVAPATANILAKAAAGFADDIISTTILATRGGVLFCPAMNSAMWDNPAVQANVAKLKEAGYVFVDPEWGALATSAEGEGWGRLADIERIVQKIEFLLLGTQELAGKKVLVTAGPTREPIDPVRFLTNYSSGKMGFALAEAARLRGASVVLITGPNHLPKIEGVRTVEIETARELKAAVEREYPNTDILLMAAAVADYEAKKVAPHKLKKSGANLTIELQRAPDILASLGKKKVDCIHVGFALETEKGHANALKKLHAKNLDLIVLNNQLEPGAGFAGDTNVVSILTKDGQAEKLPQMPKAEVAQAILDRVCALVQQRLERVAAG